MSSVTPRRWVKRSATQWQELLSQFDASGLSVPAFCQQEAISEGSFYRWRAQLAGGASPVSMPSGQTGFIELPPLNPRSAANSTAHLEISLRMGSFLTLTWVRG